MDVLIGLGCNGALVSKMWHFLWLTLGLDVDKIIGLARAVVTHASGNAGGRANGGGGMTNGAGTAKLPNGQQAASEVTGCHVEMDPAFSVLTLCCQATQYRLM